MSSTDQSNAAASALGGVGSGATFVTLNTGSGLEHYLVTDDAQGREGAAFSAARGMAAHSKESDEVPDLLSAGGFAQLQIQPDSTILPDIQAGADFTSLSKIIGDMLKPNEWVAVSVRKPMQRFEQHLWHIWVKYGGVQTHHSLSPTAKVVSFYAGGEDNARARDLISRTVDAIPGFGLVTKAKPITAARSAGPWLFSALLLAAVSWAGFELLDGVLGYPVGWWSAAAAIACLVACGLTWASWFPSRYRALLSHLTVGKVPPPKRRLWKPAGPRNATTIKGTDGQQIEKEGRPGDYPLHARSFMVGSHIPLAFVAPHASGSGGSSTAGREAPGELRRPIGPPLGVNLDRKCWLDANDLWGGFLAVGEPGSGKTAYMEQLWGWWSLQRVAANRGEPVMPGVPIKHTMIAFDTKGDRKATEQYVEWSRSAGDRALVVDVFDRTPPIRVSGPPREVFQPIGIDLFPDRGDGALAWGRQVTNALRYIWGEDSIGARSFDTLSNVFAAAKLVTPDMAAAVQAVALDPDGSPFSFADILLCNKGDEAGVQLYAKLQKAAADVATTDATNELVAAVANLAPLYGPGVTQAQRRQLVDAPRTKVGALMPAESWWKRKTKLPWSTILQDHLAVVVNTGVAPDGSRADDTLRIDMSGLLLYTLVDAMKDVCIGWWDRGYAVSVFSDEVKHLANVSAETLTWMRHDARSFGVRPVFATQTPETLPLDVRRAVFGFPTLMLYTQRETQTLAVLTSELGAAGGDWDTADLANLAKYEAIIRTSVAGRRQEPFTTQIPDYRQRRIDGTYQHDLVA